MGIENEKRFYIDFNYITRCYPREVSKRVENFGVLEEYKGKKFTLREINQIIADLVVKTPFISGSMYVKVNVMGMGYHHILNFYNYQYKEQERTDEESINFLYAE